MFFLVLLDNFAQKSWIIHFSGVFWITQETVMYKEQYKAKMVDQELEETKMVDGGCNSKSKAPYQH